MALRTKIRFGSQQTNIGGQQSAADENGFHHWLRQNLNPVPIKEWTRENFEPNLDHPSKMRVDDRAGGDWIRDDKSTESNSLRWEPIAKPISSYNWQLDSWTPTVIVPGAPKIFLQWPGGKLSDKEESVTVDEDSYRNPKFPLEPIFCSIRICQPDYKISNVDLIADVSCIKKLARFVLECIGEKEIEYGNRHFSNRHTFRMDIQTIEGGPVAIMRRERNHTSTWLGYGFAFARACAENPSDINLRGPHKRITEISLGGLKLLIRHKVLAGVCATSAPSRLPVVPEVSSTSSSVIKILNYSQADRSVSDYEPIELASLGSNRVLTVDKWLDMVLTGTQHLFIGYHNKGNFVKTQLVTRQEVKMMCGINNGENVVRSMEHLLKQIITSARSHNHADGLALVSSLEHESGDKKLKMVLRLHRLFRPAIPFATPQLKGNTEGARIL